MEIFIEIIAILLGVVGLLGCILPVLPGPPLSYIALVLLYFFTDNGGEPSGRFMIIWLIITIVVTILDYIVPAYFTKVTGGSKAAARGSLGGMLLGLFFFPPFGMIIGGFVGAMLLEIYYNNKSVSESLLPAFGSFLGFLFGTGLKLIASGVMLYYLIIYSW